MASTAANRRLGFSPSTDLGGVVRNGRKPCSHQGREPFSGTTPLLTLNGNPDASLAPKAGQPLHGGVMTAREAKGEGNLHPAALAHTRNAAGLSFSPRLVTVLCAARSSIYQGFPAVSIFTASKNALNARPLGPVVTHAPCRCWSRGWARVNLSVANRIKEMHLAYCCLRWCRRNGGVFEHPAYSQFWQAANLPRPGDLSHAPEEWCIQVDQANWGHRSTKPTWLLFCHIDPEALYLDGFTLSDQSNIPLSRLTPGQRSATPQRFAAFLLLAARTAKAPRWEQLHRPAFMS